jgi:hypothetical protein
VRDARGTGPRSAIDQFETGNAVPEPLTARGGIVDDGAGGHTPVCSRLTTERTVIAAERLGLALGVAAHDLRADPPARAVRALTASSA